MSDRDTARFWSKVALPDAEGHMLWLRPLTAKGYARFQVRGRGVRAHRFSYELAYGPIAEGLQVDHLCRVRHCVAPEHLEAVTPRENVLRGQGLPAQNARKTHCPKGHPYSGDNLHVKRCGRRHCRACNREQFRERGRRAS